MLKGSYVRFFVFLSIVLISYTSIQNPYSTTFINDLKTTSKTVSKMNDPLYEKIRTLQNEYSVPPINAKIDPVWKAIPGYNGLAVDVNKSYAAMKKAGSFEERMLVYKEHSPEIHLNDLPAAPIYKGNPEKQMIAFIINVAWGNEYIPDLLKILKKHQLTVSFFLEGKWVSNHPDLTKMIAEAGHELGNHSYTHADFKMISIKKAQEELVKTNAAIEAVTGQTPVLFGPPSGSYRDEIVTLANDLKMNTVLWSVDTIDWKKPPPQVIVQRIREKAHPGALILMHPTASTALALEQMIQSIENKGFKIGTVSALLSEERTSLEPQASK